MSRLARPSRSATFRRLLASFLLLLSCTLPLHAWAVDTDGDGVDDSIDAFPNNPEATTDTDGDGLPDTVDYTKDPLLYSDYFTSGFGPGWSNTTGWTVTNGTAYYSGLSTHLQRSFTVSGNAYLRYTSRAYDPATHYLYIDGIQTSIKAFPYNKLETANVVLSPGTHTVQWESSCTAGGFGCVGTTAVLDDVELRQGVPLVADTDDDNDGVLDAQDAFPLDATESVDTDHDGIGNNADADDDNDGVPDYIDADPLNATINTEKILPMNNTYRGSVIRESQAFQ